MRKVLYILGDLDDADLQWLAEVGSPQRIPAGTEVAVEGQPLDDLFIVLEGELVASSRGTEVARLGVGEVIGDMSLLDQRAAGGVRIVAAQDSILFAVPRGVLEARLAEDVPFAARFYRALGIFLSHRLRRASALLGQRDQDQITAPDELPDTALEATARAGARFEWFVGQVRGRVR